jgi:hypothetical protein
MSQDDTAPISRASTTYSGTRTSAGCVVAVTTVHEGTPSSHLLRPQLDVRRYAQHFDWGNLSRGAKQLAVSLLVDHLRDSRLAAELHLRFTEAVVSRLPQGSWTLTDAEIDAALGRLGRRP